MVILMLVDIGVCWGEVFVDLFLLFFLLWFIRFMEEVGVYKGFFWLFVNFFFYFDEELIFFNG